MSTKEFIKSQLENFHTPVNSEEFIELTERENSLIILQVPVIDYTLTEIARLIESNNAHVLKLTVIPTENNSDLLISIKLDISDLTNILRSFERFNYEVVYYFMKEGEINETQKDRLQELLHYLDM